MKQNSRLAALHLVACLCGCAGVLEVDDPGNGWPARATAVLPEGGRCPVLLYIGRVGLSHRGRDHVERRMQNPGKGKPVVAADGALPLLIGLWEEGSTAVLVGMDARRHLGRLTRKSLFVPLRTLEEAAVRGWAEHRSASGEAIVAFRPAFLAEYVRRRACEWPDEWPEAGR